MGDSYFFFVLKNNFFKNSMEHTYSNYDIDKYMTHDALSIFSIYWSSKKTRRSEAKILSTTTTTTIITMVFMKDSKWNQGIDPTSKLFPTPSFYYSQIEEISSGKIGLG